MEYGADEQTHRDAATGRLFRSLHADGASAADAIVALNLDDVVRLRTVSLSQSGGAGPEPALDPDFAHLFAEGTKPMGGHDPVVVEPVEADASIASEFAAAFPDDFADESADVSVDESATPFDAEGLFGAEGLTAGIPAWTAIAMIVGVTVFIGFADVFVTGQLGWLTGIALVLVSCYAAATIRPHDGYWAVVTPALAFLLTTVTVGQATVTGGGFWVRQGLLIPFTLGRAAVWIVLATVAAALIVGVRRRRVLRG